MNIHTLQALLTFEETLAILKITRPTLYKIMNNNLIDVDGGFKAIKDAELFNVSDYVCPSTLL